MRRHRTLFLRVAGKEVGQGRDHGEEVGGRVLEGSWGPDPCHSTHERLDMWKSGSVPALAGVAVDCGMRGRRS